MTVPDVPAELVRLHVTCRPAIDTEGPYLDAVGGYVDGSLALTVSPPRRTPGSEPVLPPLRLVPEPSEPAPAGESGGAPDEGAPCDEMCFDPVRTPRVELPALGRYAATLTRLLLEVLAGDRPVRQMTRCATPAVCDEVEVLVNPRASRPWAGSLRRLVICEPMPGVAEVTAVVTQGLRTIGLALRLEGVDGRWQLTALQFA